MVQFHSCISIPVDCCTPIKHVAFDGCDYFGTIRCKCEIIRLNPCNSALHRYCTCREYDCICYDYSEHCFWASSRACCSTLFKLDCCMNEIDCISICALGQYGMITGISYDCCKNTLVVSFPCAVVEIEKCGSKFRVLYTMTSGLILDVLSISPGLLITVLKDNKYEIHVLNQCGKKLGCYCLDCCLIPRNLIFNPCTEDCHQSQIVAFAFKHNYYPYLCSTDLSVDDLGFIPCCCNYEICHECCCSNQPRPDCDPHKDIMESIALIETALSHILNAEGEKIQKALGTTDDLDKIMCVNREVNKTIVNVTHLEHTLYAKLSALSDCGLCEAPCCNQPCCDPCDEPKDCCAGENQVPEVLTTSHPVHNMR